MGQAAKVLRTYRKTMIVVVNETTSVSSPSNDGSFLKISTLEMVMQLARNKQFELAMIGPSITTLLETLGL